jgi:PTH1 family peptidyl-tRNA hydrolase
VHGYVLSDFAKSDKEWLEVLLDLMADSADLSDKLQPTSADDTPPPKAPRPHAPKAQSHIRQARPNQPVVKLPETGPMAVMLKKLLGKD